MAAFCLLHGAWHEPSCWDPLRKVLHERGHETAAPDLPLHDPAAGYPERVRPAIDAVARFDEPAVVVGHSQSSGLAPLVAAARPAAKVVYLCPRRLGPFEESPEDAPAAFREGLPMPQGRDDGTSAWDPETAATAMYGRLPEDTARELAQRLRPMAMPSDAYPLASPPDAPAALISAPTTSSSRPSGSATSRASSSAWSRSICRADTSPWLSSLSAWPTCSDHNILCLWKESSTTPSRMEECAAPSARLIPPGSWTRV